jgi:hypothetical protein
MRLTSKRRREMEGVARAIDSKVEQYRTDLWADYMFGTGLSWRFIMFVRERVE